MISILKLAFTVFSITGIYLRQQRLINGDSMNIWRKIKTFTVGDFKVFKDLQLLESVRIVNQILTDFVRVALQHVLALVGEVFCMHHVFENHFHVAYLQTSISWSLKKHYVVADGLSGLTCCFWCLYKSYSLDMNTSDSSKVGGRGSSCSCSLIRSGSTV